MLRLNCSQMRIGLRGWSRVSSHKLSTLENAKPFEDIPAPPGKLPFRGFYYCSFLFCSTSAFIKPSQVIEQCVIVYTRILISIPQVSTFQQSLKSLLVVLLSSNDTFPIVMRLQLLHVMLHRCLDSIHRLWICHVQATRTEESR